MLSHLKLCYPPLVIELSTDQKSASDKIFDWHKSVDKAQYITLGGYAGTGKTTLISHLRNIIHKEQPEIKIAFCSYTGKAARVLQTKLTAMQSIYSKDSIGTIHSLMYSPVTDNKENIVGWERKENINADLIIIDEGSMVDSTIWADLTAYHIPILVVGDHGQLEPVNGTFNLMVKPQLTLTEIHRQERDNPIIKLSILARETGQIPYKEFGHNIMKLRRGEYDTQSRMEDLISNANSDTLILCGYNTTRTKINNFVRSSQGFDDPLPQARDRVICLRNNHQEHIFNGMLGTIQSITHTDPEWYFAQIKMDDEIFDYKGLISAKQFNADKGLNMGDNRRATAGGDLFDFGYALTVHKAQGSEAKRVVLFEERFPQMNDESWRRWLYTAVTRAREELFIIG